MTSFSDAELAVEGLRQKFEGREGIYIEKGAVRIKVVRIWVEDDLGRPYFAAEVEEIRTPGLEDSNLITHLRRRFGPGPIRWRIGAAEPWASSGGLEWYGRYGPSIFFEPETVQAVVDLAATRPANLSSWDLYGKIVDLLALAQAWQSGTEL